MLRRLYPLLTLVLLFLILAHPALAQGVTGTGSSNSFVTWQMLDPGNDWAADMIRSIFPVVSSPDGTSGPAGANNVIGTMLGELTAFVAVVAMIFISYSIIMHVHRGAETSQLLGNNQTSMRIVGIGFAAVMMFPIAGGFSLGQQLVVRGGLIGVGMAKTVYANAVKGLGPDGQVIAQPMIPGTKAVVVGLIRNEMCRDILNLASAQSNLVPVPSPVTTVSVSGPGTVSWNYSMSDGNGNGEPACGTVSIRTPNSLAQNILGMSVDMAQAQRDVLEQILANDIRNQVSSVASNLFNNRNASDLQALSSIFTTAAQDYRARLTEKASQIRQQLESAIQKVDRSKSLDSYLNNTQANQQQLSALGWSAAGAYFLEFAQLNAQTLSLMNGTPTVEAGGLSGLGPDLSKDAAPLLQSSYAFLDTLAAYANTNDGLDAPGGNAELMRGVIPGSDGASVLDEVAHALHLNDYVLQFTTYLMNPPSAWTDPFGNLMALGNDMILAALSALGLSALLSSATGTAGSVVFSILTAQPQAVLGAMVGHAVIGRLGGLIVAGCMALLLPGLTIAYVLPMIPYVLWIGGVIGWLIMLCEAVIAVPLWALAHMTTSGEGLHGKAQQGYALLFNVVFRPVLMIFGLFIGYVIFDASCWLIRQTFGIAAGAVLGNGWFVTNLIGVVVLLGIFVLLHFVAASLSFQMIYLVPHHVPRMIGFSDGGRVDMDRFGRDVALIGMGKTLNHLSEQMNALAPGKADDSRIANDGGQRQIGGNKGEDPTMRAAGTSED